MLTCLGEKYACLLRMAVDIRLYFSQYISIYWFSALTIISEVEALDLPFKEIETRKKKTRAHFTSAVF